MKRLAAYVWLSSLVAGLCSAAEMDVYPPDDGLPSVIHIEGELFVDDHRRFQSLAIPLDEAIVVFNSVGGNLQAGIEIGRTIRIKGFATLVLEESVCASACALAWLGGNVRFASIDGYVGFHAAYMRSLSGEMVTSATGNAIAGSYLNSLGMSDRAIAEFTIAKPDEMRQLTPDTAQALGIQVNWLDPADDAEVASDDASRQEMASVDPSGSSDAEQPAWEALPDVDLPGGDLPDMPLSLRSWRECQTVCEGDNACVGYTFNQEYRVCFLKGYIREGLPFTGAFSGYRPNLVQPPDVLGKASNLTPFQTSRGYEIVGRPVWRFTDVTHEWCHDECIDSRMCEGYTFYQNGDCNFLEDASNLQRASGVVSGRKLDQ
ncbi:PAN domain-containing protein [Pararhizobium haloflavum]|uniref:PAN domain-containing protein n=1 Tax=Pararhizobium haloflavum TaxID=2037914 RepID=UPI001300047F|nr:PAN domain-containing protein [Pararhizobium haloflavum]